MRPSLVVPNRQWLTLGGPSLSSAQSASGNLARLSSRGPRPSGGDPRGIGADSWTIFLSPMALDGSTPVMEKAIMIGQSRPRGFTSSVLIVALPFLCCAPDLCWAKHKKAVQTSSDPCAAPIAFVQDHINKIKALQKAPPHPKSSVYSALLGQDPTSKESNTVEIATLRDEADGVNALLRSGGCKTFDIDHELKEVSASP